MASTGQLNIQDLTPDNGAITDLRELLFLSVMQSPALESTFTVYPGAEQGKNVSLVGKMGMVGEYQPNCEPAWNATSIDFTEKKWDLGEWTISEQICYKDLMNTLVRHAMRTKTSVADLTGTDYIDIVVEPKLREAMSDMLWRLSWFGDKDADNVSNGGILTNGLDNKYFTISDGFFKRLFAITAANADQKISIAANTAATYQAQRDGIRQEGVAIGIMDKLVYDADIRIRQAADRVVLCTQSFADALAIDAKRTTGSDLQWESLFDGLVSATRFNGEEILAINKWDTMIKAFEDNGTTLNKPHRALYTSKSNLLAGVRSNNLIEELQIWFSQDHQVNRLLARDEMGTMILDEEMIRFAY